MSRLVDTKNKKIILGTILLLVIVGGSYGAYAILNPMQSNDPSEQNSVLTLTDYKDVNVTVNLPVERVACLSGGLTEIFCTLGGQDKIVARIDSVIFPPSILDVTSLAAAARDISAEALLDMDLDLVIADTAFSDDNRAAIEAAGVPVIIETTGDLARINTIITNFGLILDNSEKATEVLENIEYYTNLVDERITNANLATEEKTTFYVELTNEWRSRSDASVQGALLTSSGGINIVTDTSVMSPTVSAEVVVESNPDVIIKLYSKSTSLTDYQEAYAEIMNRTALQETTAVTSGQVYVCYWYLTTGEMYPVGELYFAKWLYPDLFADIDPSAIHAELVQDYYGIDLTGTWAYPSANEPEPTEPETVTVVDVNGDEITVSLPVERVVSISNGLTEAICALGCEDLIVGRDSGSTFPSSILSIDEVGASSYTPNVEMVLEKEPDLVVAGTMLNSNQEVLTQLRNAGIPVYIEKVSNYTRMTQFINDMGLVLDKETEATELVEYLNEIYNLVTERVATVMESEKPIVYAEWNNMWRTFKEGQGVDLMIVAAGGINIATVGEEMNSSGYISPEHVVEVNPDVILKMPTGVDGDVTVLQDARDELLSRTALSETTAVLNERVYVYDSTIYTGMRNPVGLLFFAKWLHPDLFADIDPIVVQADLIQEFFGIDLEAVYVYP
ncbi:MAG: ABC transporter substrate-binding protein [Candidatus Bathyarchaeota archaeon]|nr:ABC transporter substrate-binding protein [Candidatus Bathyarchaeum sp.]